jgi:hypothetical protein
VRISHLRNDLTNGISGEIWLLGTGKNGGAVHADRASS